jgi:hypothetical protein
MLRSLQGRLLRGIAEGRRHGLELAKADVEAAGSKAMLAKN